MATTNLNIRTDKDVKDQAEEIFNELGLSMTTAINLFLRTTIRDHEPSGSYKRGAGMSR